ncbi:MAG: hypothetical protein C0618_07995 [Desulfuromonas sp.]|nr:MAG: hypothetical protein C0618_07995 [Desulfuromonas sp.]
MPLSRFVLFRVWLRLFLLQGSWNFERLQGLGFFFALFPALQKLHGEDRLVTACQQHAGYFNTHPYLAPMVAGAVLKLETDRQQGLDPAVDIQDFKDMVAAPYAAIGDALFWGGLRPLAAGFALLFAVKGIVLAPLIFLVSYNFLPLCFRTLGFIHGYRAGLQSLEFLQRHHLPDWAIRIKEAAVVLLGGLSAFLVYLQCQGQAVPKGFGFLAIPVVILLGLCARRGTSTLLLVLLTAAAVVCACLFGVDPTGWM